jgi:ABC-type oligopeptide transport system substrate-binding subunit
MAGLYAKNGDSQAGKQRIKELANSLEEWLAYYASFTSSQKSSISNQAGYQLALYDELIKQATGTLSEQEINQMRDKLLDYAQKLG